MEMLREESARLRSQTERLRTDRTALQQRLDDTETSLHEAQEELRFDRQRIPKRIAKSFTFSPFLHAIIFPRFPIS